MAFYGDFRAGQTVRCRFNTVSSAGAPITLASGAVVVSKDGADVTPSGGVTLSADAGGVTGFHRVVIDTSVDATTFTAGSEYCVRLSAGTVGGTSVVGMILGEWSIANRAVAVSSTGAVTAGTVSDKTGYGMAAAQSFNNTGQTNVLPADLQTIKAQAVTASAGVTFPASIGTSTYAGADTGGTTTLLSRLGSALTISGGKVAATVASGDSADAASVKATLGTAGAGLTAVPYTGPSAGTIQSGLATATALAALATTVGTAGAGLTSIPYTGPAAPDLSSLATSAALGAVAFNVSGVKAKTDALTIASGKVAASLAAADVSGNLPARVNAVDPSLLDASPETALIDPTQYAALAKSAQVPAAFTDATFAAPGVFSGTALANAPTGGGGSGTALTADQVQAAAAAAIVAAGLPARSELVTTADMLTSADLTTALGTTPVGLKASAISTATFAAGATVPLPTTPPTGYGGLNSTQTQAAAAAAIAATTVVLPPTAPAGYGGSLTTAQVQAACASALAITPVGVKAGGIVTASFAVGTSVPLPSPAPDGYGGAGSGSGSGTGGSSLTTLQVQTACAAAIASTAAVLPPTAPPGYGAAGVPLTADQTVAACASALGSTPVGIRPGGIADASFAAGSAVPLPATAPAGYGGASSLDLTQVQSACASALTAYGAARPNDPMALTSVDRARFLTTQDVADAVAATPVAVKVAGIATASFAAGASVPLPATAPAGYGGAALDPSQVQSACASALATYAPARAGDAMTLTTGLLGNLMTSADLESALSTVPVGVKPGGIATASFAAGSAVPLPTTPPTGYGSTVDAAGLVAQINLAGVKLAPDGMDRVMVEDNVNARQALTPILAASAGNVINAGSGTMLIKGANSNITRITATSTPSGDRTNVLLSLPA